MPQQMDAAELGAYIDERLTKSAFRLEVLDRYDVSSDGEDYRRFLAGESEPTMERKQPWMDRLRREADAGILNHRVHVLLRPLTDYLRYECEWGYLLNAEAGEDIRILDTTDRPPPDGIADHDYWLIDDQYPIRMYYGDGGVFLYAEESPEHRQLYRMTRDVTIAAADSFNTWWQAHPDEWRSQKS